MFISGEQQSDSVTPIYTFILFQILLPLGYEVTSSLFNI